MDFSKGCFRFFKHYIDLTDYLDKIYESKEQKGEMQISTKNKKLTFEKCEDNIKITIEGKEPFNIDKNPICFLDKEKNCLFKIYDSSNKNQIEIILGQIDPHYSCNSEKDEIIKLSDIIDKGMKTIILKSKIESNENKFKLLSKILSEIKESESINTSCILPEKSESLSIDINSTFELMISQRIILTQKINKFVQDKNKTILKIYGTDGIGKSVSFLYYMLLKNNYKIIYFNLKDIFKYKSDVFNYFKNAMMKYFSSNNFVYQDNYQDNDEDLVQVNYEVYLNQIKKFEEQCMERKTDYGFWQILFEFCKYIKIGYSTLIIIDQYKSEYDMYDKLNTSILKFHNSVNTKFIIASSLNDNTVKIDFIQDLKEILKEKPIEKESEKHLEKKISGIGIEDELFKDFDFNLDKNIFNYETDINKDFSLIKIFNTVNQVVKEKEKKVEQKKIEEEKEEKNDKLFDKKKVEIIYINNLVSIKSLVKNENVKEILKLFNYNPKSLVKYNEFSKKNQILDKEILRKKFLEARYNEIKNKVDYFYTNLNRKNPYQFSHESLKGTNLIKLNEIIKNKTKLDLRKLIEYLDGFPFKYLKIYIAEEAAENNNIINMDSNLNEKYFLLDYAYNFVEIAFSKIIYMLPSSTSIYMNELSDSAIGSLLENKIKKYLENNNFEIRYYWNFTNVFSKGPKDKNEKKSLFDYQNFKKIEFDDDKENINLDYTKNYYIIPGSQNNPSLDSIILVPNKYDSFNMGACQITKHKKIKKTKKEYIDDSFIAKSKLEKKYKIKIDNIYFYFILGTDFPSDDTKKQLESQNISYISFSIKDQQFLKDEIIFDLTKIKDEKAKISQEIKDNEYKYFNTKKTLINLMESFLQKKRNREIKITEKLYNKARKYLFNLTSNIYLDDEIKSAMTKFVKKINTNLAKESFTFQFVFTIDFNESRLLVKSIDDLIGIIIDYDIPKNYLKEKCYHFLYMGLTDNEDELFDAKTLKKVFLGENDEKKRATPIKEDFFISKIPANLCERIFIFKIYIIEPTKKKKKK